MPRWGPGFPGAGRTCEAGSSRERAATGRRDAAFCRTVCLHGLWELVKYRPFALVGCGGIAISQVVEPQARFGDNGEFGGEGKVRPVLEMWSGTRNKRFWVSVHPLERSGFQVLTPTLSGVVDEGKNHSWWGVCRQKCATSHGFSRVQSCQTRRFRTYRRKAGWNVQIERMVSISNYELVCFIAHLVAGHVTRETNHSGQV